MGRWVLGEVFGWLVWVFGFFGEGVCAGEIEFWCDEGCSEGFSAAAETVGYGALGGGGCGLVGH